MRHLFVGDDTWCDDAAGEVEATDDPRDATCGACLQKAAAYGAAAAMRFAAVEAGASRDPELVRERDEAIRRLSAVTDALESQSRAFFCTGCLQLFPTTKRSLAVDRLSWCSTCAPPNKVTT